MEPVEDRVKASETCLALQAYMSIALRAQIAAQHSLLATREYAYVCCACEGRSKRYKYVRDINYSPTSKMA